MGCGRSKRLAPRLLVARMLPGWNTLLHTLPPRGGVEDDGVTGVVGVVGIDLLASPVAAPSFLLASGYILRCFCRLFCMNQHELYLC